MWGEEGVSVKKGWTGGYLIMDRVSCVMRKSAVVCFMVQLFSISCSLLSVSITLPVINSKGLKEWVVVVEAVMELG